MLSCWNAVNVLFGTSRRRVRNLSIEIFVLLSLRHGLVISDIRNLTCHIFVISWKEAKVNDSVITVVGKYDPSECLELLGQCRICFCQDLGKIRPNLASDPGSGVRPPISSVTSQPSHFNPIKTRVFS